LAGLANAPASRTIHEHNVLAEERHGNNRGVMPTGVTRMIHNLQDDGPHCDLRRSPGIPEQNDRFYFVFIFLPVAAGPLMINCILGKLCVESKEHVTCLTR